MQNPQKKQMKKALTNNHRSATQKTKFYLSKNAIYGGEDPCQGRGEEAIPYQKRVGNGRWELNRRDLESQKNT